MPTYQYACTNPECEHRLEQFQSFTDAALTECPICSQRLRKVYGSVGVVFKGSGFYRNDSRAEANGSKRKKSADSDARASSDSSSSASSTAGTSSDTSSSGSSSSGDAGGASSSPSSSSNGASKDTASSSSTRPSKSPAAAGKSASRSSGSEG